MKKNILIVIVVITIIGLLNAKFGLLEGLQNWMENEPSIPRKNEIVMPALSTIEAETPNGLIIIKSGKGLKRSYTWNGETRYVNMIPREERWYGSLGLYYPGSGFHWSATKDGIKRGVLEEGQQHFKTIDEALKWIQKQLYWGAVYRDDGLLVQFNKTGAPAYTLSVSVWQIFINGKKPKHLDGSTNNAIITSWDK